ncbi:MAG: tetratricopeptide repeat protein [Candidatus Thorarchaeota archaeon]
MSQDAQTAEQMLSKARSLKRQGQNKKAIEAYREILIQNPENLDALNEMGLAHIHIGEQSDAIIAFDLAINFAPNDFRAHSNKAEAYITLGSFDEASAAADLGLEYAPDSAELWSKKARALESLLRIDEAIEAYNKSLKYESNNPETWKALALCFDAKENWPAVARSYRIAAGLHKKRGENQDAESCYKFAELAEKSE